MTETEQFLERWETEARVTLKVLRAYPPDKADFRPHPGARTAKELAWTFVFNGIGGSQALEGELKFPPPNMPPMPDTWHGLVGEAERAFQIIAAGVRRVGAPQLNTTVKSMTGPKQMSDVRRLDFLWFLLMDTVHHRGQFSVYLRMAGGKVPSIYGPSADERWT
ncbi:MAG: DinB family protein [Gemmatimonadales bacterium]